MASPMETLKNAGILIKEGIKAANPLGGNVNKRKTKRDVFIDKESGNTDLEKASYKSDEKQ